MVEVGRETTLEVALSVGPVTGTVDVSAEAPVINTTQQDFSTNINQTSINELPINGRRWSNFALLTPGAVPDGTFGLISFRGISGLLNNSTIDGGDNNQAFFAEERGRTRISYSISQAAIREFQVNTSSYSAEYGRSAGGVVNAVTKSGTNEFHGDIFYYQRNNKWGARNPLATRTQLSQRRLYSSRLSSRRTCDTSLVARSAVQSSRTRRSSSSATISKNATSRVLSHRSRLLNMPTLFLTPLGIPCERSTLPTHRRAVLHRTRYQKGIDDAQVEAFL